MKLPKFVIDLVYPLAEFEVYAQRAIERLLERQELSLSELGELDTFMKDRQRVVAARSGATWVTNCVAHPGKSSGFMIEKAAALTVSQAVAMYVKTTKAKQ